MLIWCHCGPSISMMYFRSRQTKSASLPATLTLSSGRGRPASRQPEPEGFTERAAKCPFAQVRREIDQGPRWGRYGYPVVAGQVRGECLRPANDQSRRSLDASISEPCDGLEACT